MNIAVFPNLDKRGVGETLEKIGIYLKEIGIKAYVPNSICCSNFEPADEETLLNIADFIVTIGGDGTIIRYAKKSAEFSIPVLGINAGRMGYLANIEQNEYKLLSRLKEGKYTVEERMMLSVKLYDGERLINEYFALNDAVITSGFISRIIDISASFKNDTINYRADGIIVSTPTGSTAYSMSAGGPIIDPEANCMCITPICSHSLSAKPILLNGDKELKIKAFSKKRTEIYLSVDGRKVSTIKPNMQIVIGKAKNSAKLLRLSNKTFFKTLSHKFLDVRSGDNEK